MVWSSSCELAEGVAVVRAGSDTGPTAESFSRERAGREVGSYLDLGFVLSFGLGFSFGFVLGLEWFDSKSSLLEDLLFLEVLFPLFLFLFFCAASACCCRHYLRIGIHDVNIWRSDEGMVCNRAIVVDRRQINDTLNRFFGAGRARFRKFGFLGTYAYTLRRSPCSRFYTVINTVHIILIETG